VGITLPRCEFAIWLRATTPPHTGFIAQAVQLIFPDLVSQGPDGYYTLNYAGFAPYIVKAIQTLYAEVQGLAQTVAGFAHSITSQQVTTNQLCLSDANGVSCYTRSQIDAALASVDQSGNQSPTTTQPSPDTSSTTPESLPQNSASTTPEKTPPVIEINGDNPAVINVGATYADLGATAIDEEGHSLDVQTFFNGVEAPSITVDTSEPATDTIEYVATDTWGNTSTSSRSVIIEAAAQ
jgi:Domain of unknown function (DUF5011)